MSETIEAHEIVATVTRGALIADWYNAGEGCCGDYLPDEPDDVNFLRFDLSVRRSDGETVEYPKMSFCTLVPATTAAPVLTALLNRMLDLIFEAVGDRFTDEQIDRDALPSLKRIGEDLSYFGDLEIAALLGWCDTNDCEQPGCHRCFPRAGCEEHEKCREWTKQP